MLKARISGWFITLGMLTACVAASVTTSSFITADEAGNTLTRINAHGSQGNRIDYEELINSVL